MTILVQLAIAAIVVFIIDLSGAPEHLFKPVVRKILKLKPNANINIGPFECSMCMTFWVLMLYTAIADPKIMNFVSACFISWTTVSMRAMFELIKSVVDTIVYRIQKYIDSIL